MTSRNTPMSSTFRVLYGAKQQEMLEKQKGITIYGGTDCSDYQSLEGSLNMLDKPFSHIGWANVECAESLQQLSQAFKLPTPSFSWLDDMVVDDPDLSCKGNFVKILRGSHYKPFFNKGRW